ncbi:MAG: hypothetical protein NTW21_07875 [Verrucomicrobia bacterium]|nr:hypothetical protein [Verrucomicrobiota bacterium]
MKKKTIKCLTVGFLLALSVPVEAQQHSTGLTLPTPEEEEWMNKNMSVTGTVRVNDIGAARVNEEMKAQGLGVLDIQSVPFGAESVELGETASGPTFEALTLPSQVDNSALPGFPPVGDQGSIGSCAPFSTVYYMGTHMLNLARRQTAGSAATQLSPRFFYPMVNDGSDSGSTWAPILDIMLKSGSATWQEWPYSGTDYKMWCPDAAVWRQALGRRFRETGTVTGLNTSAGLTQLKEMITNGYVLVFGCDVFSWDLSSYWVDDNGTRVVTVGNDPATTADDSFVGQKIVRYAVPITQRGYHSMTIVGYNDSLWCDVNGNGVVDNGERGALKICNSWGTDWRNGGFVWLAYDALGTSSAVAGGNVAGRRAAMVDFDNRAYWITARASYTPAAVAEFSLAHARRNQIQIGLGRGTASDSSPSTTWIPSVLQNQGGARAFDGSTTMTAPYTFALDLTDLVASGSYRYFLSVTDSTSGYPAALSAFRVTDAAGNQLAGGASGLSDSIDARTQWAWVNYNWSTAPAISGLAPSSGAPGTTVSISGTNLGDATAVSFNGVIATSFTQTSGSLVTAVVPPGATTGLISVSTLVGTATSPGAFTVTQAPPSISSFAPTSGSPGTSVTITGSGFTGAIGVSFNLVAATYNIVSSTQIVAIVPQIASSGAIRVTTPAGTATSASSFTVQTPPPVANDNFADGQVVTGSSGTVTGSTSNATKQVGEPNHGGNTGGRSIWYRWTATSNGIITIDTNGSGFDTLLGVYTGNAVNSLTTLADDDDSGGGLASRVQLSVVIGTTYHVAVDGYGGRSGAVRLNYSFTAAPPTIAGFSPTSAQVGASIVIDGANLSGTTLVQFNGVSAPDFQVITPADGAPQIRVKVPVGASTGPIRVTTPAGSVTSGTSFTVRPAGPANDNFADAQLISGLSDWVSGSNMGATFQAGEPSHYAQAGGRSVWYVWTAPGGGTITFDTIGSGFDTVLAAYSGGSLTSLTPYGSDDDSAGSRMSRVSFVVTAGLVIRVAVDGYGSEAGDLKLNWSFQASQTPVVASFSPTSGPAGTSVVISGKDFAGTKAVRFNGVNATSFTVDSATRITATVPGTATTGRISVITAAGTGTSIANFSVTIPAPTISGFTPSSGPVGSSVTVEGTAFVGVSGVMFNGLRAVNFSVISPTQLTAIVPSGATTGQITVTTATGSSVSQGTFTVTAPPPAISSFSPASGPVGTTVSIRGSNFIGVTSVKFNGQAASYTPVNSTALSTVVPAGASTGKIALTAAGGTVLSGANFIVTAPAAPANDAFANAAVIAGSGGNISGSSLNATMEAGEPAHASSSAGRSIWYRWSPPSSGTVTFETGGSSFDTVLAAYTGSSVSSLSLLAANDDAISLQSRISFNVSTGTSYRIAVAGYGGASGTVQLSWSLVTNAIPIVRSFTPTSGRFGTSVTINGSYFTGASEVSFNGVGAQFSVPSPTSIVAMVPAGATTGRVSVRNSFGTGTSSNDFIIAAPTNDRFSDALLLFANYLPAVSGSSLGATKQSGEPNHAGNRGGASVWFKWVALSSGTRYITTAGSSFDTLLAVYSGGALTSLTHVASNDDYAGSTTSRVSFYANAGVTYYVALDGYGGASGSYSLRFSAAPVSNTLYSTAFELAEGFVLNSALVGSNGWLGTGTGGNGILEGMIAGEGQQAYVGYNAPDVGDSLLVSRPVNHTPVLGDKPVARFSVLMQITDSTNFGYDDFRWTVFNKNGAELFSINLDNGLLEVGYVLDSAPGTVNSAGRTFENGRVYELQVAMNFATNKWSALIDGAVIAANQPITTTGATLDLGKIDASWIPRVPGFPGDNRMIFDNYRIDEEAAVPLAFGDQMASRTTLVGDDIVLSPSFWGPDGTTFQWQFNGVDIEGATDPVLIIRNAEVSHSGAYNVVATDGVDTITSDMVIVQVFRHANSSFSAWLNRHFTDSQGRLISGPAADPDGDKLSNFHEYAFGSDPTSAGNNSGITVNSRGDGVEFLRLAKPEGVVYEVEFSTNLVDWVIDESEPTVVPDASAPPGYERVKMLFPPSVEGRAFTRVNAKLP